MKTVLITGGSSGVGAETAKRFASNGYNIAISYNKNKDGAMETSRAVEAYGVKSSVFQAELGREENAKRLVDAVIKEFQEIDVLVNNAGGYIDGDEWNGSEEIWSDTLSQNLISVMNVSKYVIEVFRKQGRGNMVNISSRHGLRGRYDALAYSAAKAGVINVTQAYAELMESFGGRSNSLSPSAIKTGYWLDAPKEEIDEMFDNDPGKRFLSVEEVVDSIYYLASDESGHMNGENLFLEGKKMSA